MRAVLNPPAIAPETVQATSLEVKNNAQGGAGAPQGRSSSSTIKKNPVHDGRALFKRMISTAPLPNTGNSQGAIGTVPKEVKELFTSLGGLSSIFGGQHPTHAQLEEVAINGYATMENGSKIVVSADHQGQAGNILSKQRELLTSLDNLRPVFGGQHPTAEQLKEVANSGYATMENGSQIAVTPDHQKQARNILSKTTSTRNSQGAISTLPKEVQELFTSLGRLSSIFGGQHPTVEQLKEVASGYTTSENGSQIAVTTSDQEQAGNILSEQRELLTSLDNLRPSFSG